MFIIVVGNPVDGFQFYGAADGQPYNDHAWAADEAEANFGNQAWWIADVATIPCGGDRDSEEAE